MNKTKTQDRQSMANGERGSRRRCVSGASTRRHARVTRHEARAGAAGSEAGRGLPQRPTWVGSPGAGGVCGAAGSGPRSRLGAEDGAVSLSALW